MTELAERLRALWDHLGLATAHVATQMPGDIADFARAFPDRIAGLVFCAPTRLDPAPFAAFSGRVLMIAGGHGMTAEVTARAASRLRGAKRVLLEGYEAHGWADVVADRTDTVAGSILPFLDAVESASSGSRPTVPAAQADAGRHAGISYRMSGQGPALVLLPFFLAPSQWEPAIPLLSQKFTVITLGGSELGGVAMLEDRAKSPSYRAMVRTVLDLIAPAPGETILDVGCGSGALDRMLARITGAVNPIVATDVNPFLLRSAEELAKAEGLEATLSFRRANAEALPFPDASFDCALTVTVLEECDADRALRGLARVLRPGGRLGVIVRATDLPQWWNFELPKDLRTRAETPPQSVAARGVADASLYPRMRDAGFIDLTCFPSLVTLDRPDGPIWRYREDHVLSLLSPEEADIWHSLTARARQNHLLFMAHPMHCAVGVKPHTVTR